MTTAILDSEKETINQTELEELRHDNLSIVVLIDGIKFERSLTEDLSLDENSINEWLKAQPTKVAYWSSWANRANIAKMASEYRLERIEAEVEDSERKRIWKDYSDNYEKYYQLDKTEQLKYPKPDKPTEAIYSNAVKLHPRYQDAVNRYLQACEVVGYMNAAIKALDEMRSTLISLAANMRAEHKSFENTFYKNEDNGSTKDIICDVKKGVINSFKETVSSNVVGPVKKTIIKNAIPKTGNSYNSVPKPFFLKDFDFKKVMSNNNKQQPAEVKEYDDDIPF